MNLKCAFISLGAVSLFLMSSLPGMCQRSTYLNVCQELVSSARQYEERAAQHNMAAKNIQMQIENMAKLSKNPGTSSVMDMLWNQYNQQRVLESKFRELFRQANEQANNCMKSAE